MRRPPTVVEDEVQLHHVEGAVAPLPRGTTGTHGVRCTLPGVDAPRGVDVDAPRSEQMHRSNNRMEACREGRYTPEDADAPRKDDGTQSHPDNLPRRERLHEVHIHLLSKRRIAGRSNSMHLPAPNFQGRRKQRGDPSSCEEKRLPLSSACPR
eukprot:scaffold2637_cov421-Pavlova_lutheri.AAC.2